MDLDNPFETFQRSAFRLEGLPQYLVEDEADRFQIFKQTGEVTVESNSEWSQLVKKNVDAGKTMQRLRLLSDELSVYEQFETKIYSGPTAGEEIRAVRRSEYEDTYRYDFWLFDETWIAEVIYEADGTFVQFDLRTATAEELDHFQYWMTVFQQARPLEDFLRTRP